MKRVILHSNWPEPVIGFERFLNEHGLSCQRRAGPDREVFGNRWLQYGNREISVRVVLDRSIWSIEVAEVISHPTKWYDTSLLHRLLLGRDLPVMPLAEQIIFVESNWKALAEAFDSEHRDETHVRLEFLGQERVRRLFPGLT